MEVDMLIWWYKSWYELGVDKKSNNENINNGSLNIQVSHR